jgi:uroporphyrinogen decarboxylase
MNKRDLVLELFDTSKAQSYFPAAFFLHFDPAYQRGEAAVNKHLEFFRYTGMDFVKIQYEHTFPYLPEIQNPEDWSRMPFYGQDFFEEPLRVVEGIVKAARDEALVVITLYSPFMSAGHTSRGLVEQHIRDNPEAVKKGMQVITDSLMTFVQGCIDRGVDGFYHSTQGGEASRFGGSALFEECIKPYDLQLMEEINRRCIFNILHICDYHDSYQDLAPFLDYPGHVVNAPLRMANGMLTSQEIFAMFGKPFMGGMERKGVILSGSQEEIRRAARQALSQAPTKFILGADCTIPSEVRWDNLKTAIETAHSFSSVRP